MHKGDILSKTKHIYIAILKQLYQEISQTMFRFRIGRYFLCSRILINNVRYSNYKLASLKKKKGEVSIFK